MKRISSNILSFMGRKVYSVVCLALLALLIVPSIPVFAASGSFEVHVPYTGLILGRGEDAEIEITLKNTSTEECVVDVGVVKKQEASNWDVKLVSSKWDGHGVSQVRLGTDKTLNEVELILSLKPGKDTNPGVYRFTFYAALKGSQKRFEIPITVELKGEKIAPVREQLKLETSYPVIENPAGSDFSYEVSLENNTKDPKVVSFELELPSGWTGSVTPRWESGKKIQSMKLEGSSTERLAVTVTPPKTVEKGSYPVKLVAKTDNYEASIDLSAVVTGTYELKLLPETQRLNFETTAGQETTLTLYVWNDGTAPIDNVEFFVSKPDGWKVEFEPKKIERLEPYALKGKPDQVKMIVKAPERTIPGDYQVTVTASGSQSDDTLVLRATVKVPTGWGWLGVLVIVVVLALLFGTFWKLKRR
ncbi:hypothetical protein Tlie_0439 [Thermovirga lienii DSM 17291]|uniref:Alpha-galactosidase NEW3 domain-containing protein n=1 Tax=Thermovirga lienii (strain ATCC BAA-1197 / DSM 17291 / Cas60314) TaxID=580340 RepID=G7V7L2_THELD|nr:NEW3 domain-containing protein [Thermovirga lienii]AER66174.1 hypothetical protein Tlie_0439 [Thermovirga lienii DSM 17291]